MVGSIYSNVLLTAQNYSSMNFPSLKEKTLTSSKAYSTVNNVTDINSTNPKTYQIRENINQTLEKQTKLITLKMKKDSLGEKEKYLQHINELTKEIDSVTEDKERRNSLLTELNKTLESLKSSENAKEMNPTQKTLKSKEIQLIGIDQDALEKINIASPIEGFNNQQIQTTISNVLESIDKQKTVLDVYINNLTSDLTNQSSIYTGYNQESEEDSIRKIAEISAIIAKEKILNNSQESLNLQTKLNFSDTQSLLAA